MLASPPSCAALLALAAAAAACSPSPRPPAPRVTWATASPVQPAAAAPPVLPTHSLPGPAAIAAATPVRADTLATDLDGNTFTVPAGWSVATVGPLTVVVAPERDSRVALVDVSAASPEAARDAAWQAYTQAAPPPLREAIDREDRDGWTRWKTFRYTTSPAERRRISVSPRFAHGRWCVLIYDVANAVAEKRGGQLDVVTELLAKGYARESFHGRSAARLDAAKLEQLRRFVADAELQTGVPGVSFGVIQDGNVVWSGGIGVRELGKPAQVDAKTLYLIASNTKTLTTLMLAKLVDQGRLAWDTPVTSVLPSFRLGDPEITRQVLIRHLFCACTGVPRQDLEWYFEWKGSTPESVMKTLGAMTPTSRFGELYQYSNLMAAAGGFVGGHAMLPGVELGAAYDRAMQRLVFDPLGMTATTFDYARALRGNHAMPHGLDIDGKPVRDAMDQNYAFIALRPAGAAWSNVDDLLRYVAMELADGKLADGGRYISKDALLARRAPSVTVGVDAAYGMGMAISTGYSITRYHHGGDLFGFHSDMMWIPEANVGAVVLTNGDLGTVLRTEFARKLLELLYDGEPQADANVVAAARTAIAELAARRKTLTVPADPAAVAQLAAVYRNAALGEIRVVRKAGKTLFDFGEFVSEVASRPNPDGTTSFVAIDPGLDVFAGVAEVRGGKPTLTVRDSQHEYVFSAD